MRNIKFLLGIFTLSIFLATGCKKNFSDSNATSEDRSMKKASAPNAAAKEKIDRLIAKMPKDFSTTFPGSLHRLDQHPEYRKAVLKAVHAIEPTECGPTDIDDYLDDQLADWDEDAFIYASYLGMFYLPGDLAYVFENSSNNQYFGVRGEYTQALTKTFKDLKRFWPIQTDDMALVAMHGKMMYNRDRLVVLYQLYGNSLAVSEWAAELVIEVLNYVPQYRKGDHPIFTFNAFASTEDYIVEPIPNKITMGDGILDAYVALGFGDVAPQAVLAHEFGHHIQFQLGLYTDETSPEATRRTELMADAFSAYFLSHARGASMQWKRVKQFLEVFYNIGDCAFTNDGHHGTPKQRMAAAEWAYNLSNDAQKQGHIMTPQEFAALFDTQLPEIVAP